MMRRAIFWNLAPTSRADAWVRIRQCDSSAQSVVFMINKGL